VANVWTFRLLADKKLRWDGGAELRGLVLTTIPVAIPLPPVGEVMKLFRVNPTPSVAQGIDLASALALPSTFDFYRVNVVPPGAGTKFLALSLGEEGECKAVHCSSGAANDLLHYPPSGGTINEGAAGEPVLIERGQTQLFVAITTIDWMTFP
jgi:hypothetical protein